MARRTSSRPQANKLTDNDDGALDARIQVLVASEVQKQVDRERVIVRDLGGTVLKVGGAMLALCLGLFTILGITTWKDIKRETTEFVKQRVDDLIQRSDSEESVKATLTDRVNRSVLAASRTTIAANRYGDDLSVRDWSRLKNWLKTESLDAETFSDILEALDSQLHDRKKSDANALLSEMLSPSSESQFRWILKQPDKRMAILNNFHHGDLGSAAAEVFASEGNSEEMRIAAVKYLKEVQYTEAVGRVFASLKVLSEGELKEQAILTCAALKATSSEFSHVSDSITNSSPTDANVARAVGIVREIWKYSPQEEAIDLSKKLLQFALSNGAYVSVDRGRLLRIFAGDASDEPSSAEYEAIVFVWTPYSSNGPADSVVSAVNWSSSYSSSLTASVRRFNSFQAYWTLLSDAANDGDVSRLKKLLPRANNASPGMRTPFVLMQLSKTAQVKITQNASEDITLTAADAGGLLIPLDGGDKVDAIPVVWTDKSARHFEGKIAAVSGSEFSFSLIER